MHTPKKYLFITLFQLYGLYNVFIGLVGVQDQRKQSFVAPVGGLDDMPIPLLEEDGRKGVASTGLAINLRYHQKVDRIALLVIDAMRLDFLTTHSDDMPFLRSKINAGGACVYHSVARAPTVTLPRIKALVSGDVPTYYDVISNFGASEMSVDNLLDVAKSSGKKIVFYGDETWIKLFPGRFTRSSGVTSFFVTDFYEVDTNVTSGLEKEMKKGADWDLLILHYLGLDHIGHVHGPLSHLIGPKLREMDEVVQRLWEFLSKEERNGMESLLIITSDHGMANQGGHGGDSYPEVLTPMVVLNSNPNKRMKCSKRNETIEQLDFSPTLSALWGLPFPGQCVGKVISSLLAEILTPEEHLSALLYNLNQVKGFETKRRTFNESKYRELLKRHYAHLKNPTTDISGLVRSYESLIESIIAPIRNNFSQNLLRILFGTLIILEAQIFAIVETPSLTHLLSKFPFCFLLTLPTILLSLEVSITIYSLLILSLSSKLPKRRSYLSLEIILTYASAGLLFSSSFVEEEHYLRYYLLSTAIFCTLIFSRSDSHNQIGKALLALIIHKIACSWNQTGQKWSHLRDLSDYVRESEILLKGVILAAGVCTLYLRRKSGILTHISILLVSLFKGGVLNETHYLSAAQICWSSIGINLAISLLRKPTKAKWRIMLDTLICTLLLLSRDYNTPLIPLILYLTYLFDDSFLFFLFHASFFYQGNSNNIASIDVNSGYVGLTVYNDLIVGSLIFLNTFTGPTLVVFSFIEKTLLRDCSRLKSIVNDLIVRDGWTLSIYCFVILLMRQHLFVWSVFAPKLLYLMSFTLFNALLALTYNGVNLIITYF